MRVAFAAVLVLATSLVSRADYIYDFSGVTGGTGEGSPLVGQNGWTLASGNATWLRARGTTNVYASISGTGTGAQTGAAYRISNTDAGWPFTDGITSFSLIFDGTVGNNSRIARTGLGNSSGTPFFIIGGTQANWQFTPFTGTSVTGGTIAATPSYQDFDGKLDVNLAAGTASFSTGARNSGVFTPVTGMQNMSLGLPGGFVSSDFKSLYLTIRDQGAIDDITVAAVTVVPEPATMALLGSAALCLLTLVRRRGS